jgi:hypothetical protein
VISFRESKVHQRHKAETSIPPGQWVVLKSLAHDCMCTTVIGVLITHDPE